MGGSVGIALGTDTLRALGDGVPAQARPAVLTVRPDGGVRLGEPDGGERFADFVERVGDPVPVIGSSGGVRLGADLTALGVAALAGTAAQLVIAHPAAWGPYQTRVLRSALSCTGAESMRITMVPRPVAALATAAAATGAVLVVDIDDRSTEISLVAGGRVLETSSTDGLGADPLDRALAAHILAQLPEPLDRTGRRTLVAACGRARNDLVEHTATAVDVTVASGRQRVRVVRAEYEALIDEPIAGAVSAIVRMLAAARAREVAVEEILLIGAVARVPLLWEALTARVRVPVHVPDDPAWTIARGAAALTTRHAPEPLPVPTPPPADFAEQWPPSQTAERLRGHTLVCEVDQPRDVGQRGTSATTRPPLRNPRRPAPAAPTPPHSTRRPTPTAPTRSGGTSRLRTALVAAAAGIAVLIGGAAAAGGGHDSSGGTGWHSHG